jgi:hypothetical protein
MQMRNKRNMPAMTPMTMPAMAPPLRPPPPPSEGRSVPLTPVAIGVEKGKVAVGVPVAVMMIRVELVGRNGADGVAVPDMPGDEDPPIILHWFCASLKHQ